MKRAIQLLVLGLAGTAAAFGATTFCDAFPPGTPIVAFDSNGCTQDDVTFTAFSAVTGGANNVTAPGPGEISLYGSGATPSINAIFNTPGVEGAPTWSVTGGPGSILDSILSFNATSAGVFTGLSLPFSNSDFSYDGTPGSSFTITETYCLGVTVISAGCELGPNGGTFQIQVLNGVITFNTGPVIFAPNFNVVAIQDEIVMQSGYSLFNLTNGFQDAPEPSTFVLLGSALAGVMFFRLRHSRRA